MPTADNLLSMTQSFMTPDFVQKFSGALGQPAEKIQSGLKSVLPTFLMGLVNKGSSSEGAESLVKMVKQQGLSSSETPANLNDANYLQKGNEAINGIFGNNLNSVASTLGTTTGMSSSSVTKMMGMIAPVVMGVLGKKVNQEGMSASGLMNFLGQQKTSLSSFIPSGITGLFGLGAAGSGIGAGASAAANAGARVVKGTFNKSAVGLTDKLHTPQMGEKKKSWTSLAVLAALVLGFIWWFTGNRAPKVISPTTSISTPQVTTPIPVETSNINVKAEDLGGLGAFFRSGNTNELPKRFSFQNLHFAVGTTALAQGSGMELDQIAAAMKEYPASMARVEGFTDNTGDATANQNLSMQRAQAVREELIRRGIDGGRIEAVGRGLESPIAANETDEGRAQNRRIEFIVTGI